MNLMNFSYDGLFASLAQFKGYELGRARQVCKKMKKIIDKNQHILFHICMAREYPTKLPIYEIPGVHRKDWKNIYILTDQYKVTVKRAPKNHSIIKYHKKFELIEKILMAAEFAFNVSGGIVNACRFAVLGLVSPQALNAFLRANPGSSTVDALRALGITPWATQQCICKGTS